MQTVLSPTLGHGSAPIHYAAARGYATLIRSLLNKGAEVNAIVQDDWHVRVLGPDGAVLNSTALVAGDVVLGYLPVHDRHVGYPIDELCYEQ